MKLCALASQYVAYKQAMGMRFHTEARTLKSFCRAMGDIAVSRHCGRPCVRLHRRHRARHAFLAPQIRACSSASIVLPWRGDTPPVSPLPKIIPKPPQFVPYHLLA